MKWETKVERIRPREVNRSNQNRRRKKRNNIKNSGGWNWIIYRIGIYKKNKSFFYKFLCCKEERMRPTSS